MPDLSKYFLITDLDGTLLPDNKVLNPVDIEAIDRFRRDGGLFTIATGRTRQAADRFVEQLSIDIPVVMYNGSLILDVKSNKPLYTYELPDEAYGIAKDILDKFENIGSEVLRLDNIYVVCNNEYEKRHVEICGVTPLYMPIEQVPREEWHKVLFADAPPGIDKLEEYFRGREFPVDFVRSEAHYFEILPKGSSKGAALKEYRRIFGLSGKKVIAAGDYNNDIEMLEEADIGAAPSGAREDVKQCADIVLDHTNNDGAIAELIRRIYNGEI